MAIIAVFAFGAIAAADEVALSWLDNSDNEDGFNIERAIGDGEFESIAQVGADIDTYTDSSAEPGVDYRYRVNAFNVFGYSDYTNVASHYINVVPTLTTIQDVLVEENETTNAITFIVSDFETSESELNLSIISSNEALLDHATVEFMGTGNEKSFTLTPSLNMSGDSTITITVSDGEDFTSEQFLFSVDSFDYPSLQLSLDSIAASPRVGEAFSVLTTASDPSVVSSVSYWLDDEIIETVSDFPYQASIVIPESGSFLLSAVANIVGRERTIIVDQLLDVAAAPAPSELVGNLATMSVDEATGSGTASYDLATDSFTLQDEKGEITGSSDSNRYFYLRAQGDVSIEAQISSLDSASDGSVAGLMVRSALYGKSPQASLLLSGDSSLNVRVRRVKGAPTQNREVLSSLSENPWLRIEKVGSNLSYYSKAILTDEWSLVDTDTLDLGSEVFLGFALAGGNADGMVTASFTRAGLEGDVVILDDDAVKPSIPTGLLISSLAE